MQYSFIQITSETKKVLNLALPLIAAEVIYALNGFIATAMVAHLGKEQLAASSLVWHIYVAVIIFFMGIFAAISVMVAQSFGAEDNKGVTIIFKQGLILAIILSLPMMLLMWFAPILLIWTKQNPIVIGYAGKYFYSLIWSMLPLNLWVVMQNFLVGIGRSRPVMFMCIMAVPIEILFYYAFLFGKFGLPQLGLKGIGYGLFASYSLIIIVFGTYLYYAPCFAKYNLFDKWWVWHKKFLAELFRIGIPLGCMFFSEVTFFAVIALIMGTLGVTTLAAYQIADQYVMIALVILFALSHSATVSVGNEIGRNDRERLHLTFIIHIIIGLILMALFSMFYTFFPQVAISVDIDIHAANLQDVFHEALRFFPIISILLLLDSLRIIINGGLRGFKDSKYQLLISIFGYWLIAFPMVYYLGFKLEYGGVGVWWGIVVGVLITGTLLLQRFYRLLKHIDLSSLVTRNYE